MMLAKLVALGASHVGRGPTRRRAELALHLPLCFRRVVLEFLPELLDVSSRGLNRIAIAIRIAQRNRRASRYPATIAMPIAVIGRSRTRTRQTSMSSA